MDYLKTRYPLLIGVILGAFFFFLIPVESLTTLYYTSIDVAALAFAVGFAILEGIRIYHARDKKHLLPSLIVGGVGFLACILLYFFGFSSLTDAKSGAGIAVVLILMIVGTFIATFSGEGIGTLFFLSGFYPAFAKVIGRLDYFKDITANLLVLVVALFGALVGFFLSFFVRSEYEHLDEEKASLCLGMDLAGILLIAGFQIRTPLYPVTDVPSVTAQTITIASSALAFFFIAIALSMHGYSLFNPEENETVTAPTALMAAKKVPEEKKEAAEEKKPEIQKEPKAEPLKAAEPEAAEKPAPAKTEAKKSETKGGIDVEKLKALQEKLKK
jgi:hypothetical protein